MGVAGPGPNLVVDMLPTDPYFESEENFLFFLRASPPVFPTTMENPIDRTIRLMAFAAGVVGFLVIVVLQFI